VEVKEEDMFAQSSSNSIKDFEQILNGNYTKKIDAGKSKK